MQKPSSNYAIETQNLRKVFGDNVAVKDLTLQVMQGEAFGFLGPNGAGKTTSIKMLLGLIAPTAGNARILGVPINQSREVQAVRTRVGFLPEHFRFHEWLSAEEFLSVHGQLLGMDSSSLHKRIGQVLDLVKLTPYRKKYLRTYSKGMLQRIGLAQVLLNAPQLVILDEPTSGLDPVGRRLVRDIIHDLRERGTCVFINSHILSEIELVCERVAFIQHGEVVRVIEMSELGNLRPSVSIHAAGVTPNLLDGLKAWANNLNQQEDSITMTVPDEDVIPAITRYLVENGVDIYAVHPQRLSLEDLFIQVIGMEGGL
jgi:ABC-2 type transport system ATP-binding protein